MVIPLRDNAPTYDVPWINLGLIGTCILFFIWQLNYPEGFEASLYLLGEIPARILAGEPVPGTSIPSWITMFTAMFLHGDYGHIIGNMYILWLLGDNVEWVMGRWRYLVFYLICGFLSSAICVGLGAASEVPGIGASGAIAGVMAAYLVMYPRAKITSLVWFGFLSFGHMMTGNWLPHLRTMSAYWFIGSWIVLQLLYSFGAIGMQINMNLGIYAHAAGALAGLALVRIFALKQRIPKADHYTRTDELTTVIIGDEGDGGGGYQPVNTLPEELERLRGSRSRSRLRQLPAFRDSIAEELAQQGDFAGALAQCREMLALAEREQNYRRIDGYRLQIGELERLAPQAKPASAPKLEGPYRWEQ